MPVHPLPPTALAMLAFAGNSLLCRLALRDAALDPASFTGVCILAALAGALLLGRPEGPFTDGPRPERTR